MSISLEKTKLSAPQRIVAVVFYLTVFLFACKYFNGSWDFFINTNSEYNMLFVSGSLLLIFGAYLVEPFFSKPVDVVANITAIILALFSIKDPASFFGYYPILYISFALLMLSLITILISHFPKIEKVQYLLFKMITSIGQSKIAFSVVYIATLISFFSDAHIEFVFFLSFWLVLITAHIVESTILWFSGLFKIFKFDPNKQGFLGTAIGCENPFLYKVEIDFFKHRVRDTKKGELVYLSLDNNQGAVGIIINEKQLLNKKWVTVYLLENNNAPLKVNLKTNEIIHGSKNIFSKDNSVYTFELDQLEGEEKENITGHYLYKNRENFIGYVAQGSDIGKIKFHSLVDNTNDKFTLLKEGAVIKTKIHDVDVLYQIIDGRTDEEELDKHSIYGYLTGLAQKLGRYDFQKEELDVVKWLPNIYAPVFFDNISGITKNELSIGVLPETSFQIVIKDVNSLVTHNTAILGILGIGKSCLTFELIQKVLNSSDTKIICLDITNEYDNQEKGLPIYIKESLIDSGVDDINKTLDEETIEIQDSRHDGGNVNKFKELILEDLNNFVNCTEKRIRIINPEEIRAIKQTENAKNRNKNNQWEMYAATSELTSAEITRIISEAALEISKRNGMSSEAKILIVFEEAHSLVPEWNSVSQEGDKNAVNGTSKVILQGRKYGLGSLVITQRTANISKNILNQCNTIFSLRIFDDTGKQFLENYIGNDYANTLPTLEERHAVVIGKALRLKQPVIVKLNHKDDVIIKK